MNIRCIVIDDEPLALQQLSAFVKKIPYLELVKACSGPTQAMEVLASEPVDAIFTDIEMPDINGLEYIKTLKDKPIVVFVTAYPNFAIEGFQVDATDYLKGGKKITFPEQKVIGYVVYCSGSSDNQASCFIPAGRSGSYQCASDDWFCAFSFDGAGVATQIGGTGTIDAIVGISYF